MAFALRIDRDLAWAQALREYRPMGVAAIAVTNRFQARDFRAARPAPPKTTGLGKQRPARRSQWAMIASTRSCGDCNLPGRTSTANGTSAASNSRTR